MNDDDLLQLRDLVDVVLLQTSADQAPSRHIAPFWDFGALPTLQHALRQRVHRHREDNEEPPLQRKFSVCTNDRYGASSGKQNMPLRRHLARRCSTSTSSS